MNIKTPLQYLLIILALSALAAHAELPNDAIWIDVRSPGEYEQGHLDEAANIPFDGIEVGVAGLKVDKDSPIYLYCAVGGRAEIAKKRLEAQGYSNITNVGSLDNARALADSNKP